MMNKSTKNLMSVILVVAIFLFGIVLLNKVNAAGSSYSPYSPYGEHLPEDTGIIGMDFLSSLGIVMYVGGLASLASTKTIKDKVSKILNK